MKFNGQDIWNPEARTVQQQEIREPEDLEENKEADTKPEQATSSKIGTFLPISYTQLNRYNLAILAERYMGEQVYESEYKIVYINTKLSKFEKEVLMKRILNNCPSFLHIYMRRIESNTMEFVLRKRRMNQEKMVFSGRFQIQL